MRLVPRSRPHAPEAVRRLLGPPALTPREDPAEHQALCEALAEAVGPRDAVDWVHVRNLADLEWDVRRLRRAKAAALALARPRALAAVLDHRDEDEVLSEAGAEALGLDEQDEDGEAEDAEAEDAEESPPRVIIRYVDGPAPPPPDLPAEGRRVLAAKLARAGWADETVEGEALIRALATAERLDRLIAAAETRRDAVLRDIYRRREAVLRLSLLEARLAAPPTDPLAEPQASPMAEPPPGAPLP